MPNAAEPQSDPTSDQRTFDIAAVRADFPILRQTLRRGRPLVFLDTAASAQKPQCVIAKEAEVEETCYANAYRGVYDFGARVDEQLEATRENVRLLIGAAETDEIIFTSGTTMSINVVANGWGRKFLKPGDEILVNEMEHHANLVPWQQVAAATGATLQYIPLTDDGRLALDQLDRVLTNKTKLVAVTAMSNVLGTINPVERIAARAHEVGARVLVDAAQSISHAPVDVQVGSIDFLAFSGHKLYGPSGIGILYGRRELLEAMDPLLSGGHMISRVFRDHATWAELPAKFEAGTIPIVQAIALGTAIDYVRSIGFAAIREHEAAVLRHAHQRLTEIPGLKIYGPDLPNKASITSFSINGMSAEDLAQLLNLRGVFVRHGHHCTMPLHDWLGVPATVRASYGMYNTTDEVDALVSGIQFARQKLRLS